MSTVIQAVTFHGRSLHAFLRQRACEVALCGLV